MIYASGVSMRGKQHEKEDSPCQDAFAIIKCSGELVVAAVADGLGSQLHSGFAARVAADESTEYCAAHLCETSSEEKPLEVIKNAFHSALELIERRSQNPNGDFSDAYDLDQCDTTLTAAVILDDYLYYGQSGDSGIIALMEDGHYEAITTQQRDEEGRVYPLCFGESKWEIGRTEQKVAAVLLATDGILETFSPCYLKEHNVGLYIGLLRYYTDIETLGTVEDVDESIRERIESVLGSIPSGVVDDDKTLVVIINDNVKPEKQPPEYYATPEWETLRQKWRLSFREQAYPGLM